MNDRHELHKRLTRLPSVDALLKTPTIGVLCGQYPRARVVAAIREVLQQTRTALMKEHPETLAPEQSLSETLAQAVVAHLAGPPAMSFRPAINAMGILLHDALGGVPFSPAARDAIMNACGSVLFDSPDRDGWGAATEALLCRLTEAEDALVVQNTAAAVWLAIDTLGRGKEVIISRGHLGTIEGDLRLLDLIERCGAHVIEVGATNKTHLKDYRAAIRNETGALITVRPTTYALRGFVQDVPVEELVRLGAAAGIPVLYDLGHAPLTPLLHFAWQPAVSARDAVQMGVAVAVIRGDGLVGGPECGIAVGQRAVIDRLRRNPLARTVRLGKLAYAGLEATLRHIDPEASERGHHPALWMLSDSIERVAARAARLLAVCQSRLAEHGTFEITDTVAYLTPSRLPSECVPSCALAIRLAHLTATVLVSRLQSSTPAVLGTIVDDKVLLDLRAVRDEEIDTVSLALEAILKNACVNSHPPVY